MAQFGHFGRSYHGSIKCSGVEQTHHAHDNEAGVGHVHSHHSGPDASLAAMLSKLKGLVADAEHTYNEAVSEDVAQLQERRAPTAISEEVLEKQEHVTGVAEGRHHAQERRNHRTEEERMLAGHGHHTGLEHMPLPFLDTYFASELAMDADRALHQHSTKEPTEDDEDDASSVASASEAQLSEAAVAFAHVAHIALADCNGTSTESCADRGRSTNQGRQPALLSDLPKSGDISILEQRLLRLERQMAAEAKEVSECVSSSHAPRYDHLSGSRTLCPEVATSPSLGAFPSSVACQRSEDPLHGVVGEPPPPTAQQSSVACEAAAREIAAMRREAARLSAAAAAYEASMTSPMQSEWRVDTGPQQCSLGSAPKLPGASSRLVDSSELGCAFQLDLQARELWGLGQSSQLQPSGAPDETKECPPSPQTSTAIPQRHPASPVQCGTSSLDSGSPQLSVTSPMVECSMILAPPRSKASPLHLPKLLLEKSPMTRVEELRQCTRSEIVSGKTVEHWDEADVCSWLWNVAAAPKELLNFVHSHAINGLVLLSLSDLDIHALQIPSRDHRDALALAANQLRTTMGQQFPTLLGSGSTASTNACPEQQESLREQPALYSASSAQTLPPTMLPQPDIPETCVSYPMSRSSSARQMIGSDGHADPQQPQTQPTPPSLVPASSTLSRHASTSVLPGPPRRSSPDACPRSPVGPLRTAHARTMSPVPVRQSSPSREHGYQRLQSSATTAPKAMPLDAAHVTAAPATNTLRNRTPLMARSPSPPRPQSPPRRSQGNWPPRRPAQSVSASVSAPSRTPLQSSLSFSASVSAPSRTPPQSSLSCPSEASSPAMLQWTAHPGSSVAVPAAAPVRSQFQRSSSSQSLGVECSVPSPLPLQRRSATQQHDTRKLPIPSRGSVAAPVTGNGYLSPSPPLMY